MRLNFLKMITGIFEKIYSNFSICHVHPNNLSGVYILNGVQIPSNIEVTFIRNDLINGLILNSKVSLPHSLDKKNFNKAPEIKIIATSLDSESNKFSADNNFSVRPPASFPSKFSVRTDPRSPIKITPNKSSKAKKRFKSTFTRILLRSYSSRRLRYNFRVSRLGRDFRI